MGVRMAPEKRGIAIEFEDDDKDAILDMVEAHGLRVDEEDVEDRHGEKAHTMPDSGMGLQQWKPSWNASKPPVKATQRRITIDTNDLEAARAAAGRKARLVRQAKRQKRANKSIAKDNAPRLEHFKP